MISAWLLVVCEEGAHISACGCDRGGGTYICGCVRRGAHTYISVGGVLHVW